MFFLNDDQREGVESFKTLLESMVDSPFLCCVVPIKEWFEVRVVYEDLPSVGYTFSSKKALLARLGTAVQNWIDNDSEREKREHHDAFTQALANQLVGVSDVLWEMAMLETTVAGSPP